jgi:hypothetical protein
VKSSELERGDEAVALAAMHVLPFILCFSLTLASMKFGDQSFGSFVEPSNSCFICSFGSML